MMNHGGLYAGTELDVFATAANWRGYWCGLVRPYVGASVLEVGAGLGSVTSALYSNGIRRWLALEPDPRLAAHIASRKERDRLSGVEILQGTLESVPSQEKFETILYIDVLEHIADDAGEVARALTHLDLGGHLIILSPAHQLLYSEFDQAIGHYRRYNSSMLRRLKPPTLESVFIRYLDSVGLLASAANRLLLRSARPSRRQVAAWDRGMVPISRIVDPLMGYGVGKSVLAVWRRS